MHPNSIRIMRLVALFAVLALLLIPLAASAAPKPSIEIQILNVSDWHGQLDPQNIVGIGNVGGAGVIAAYWNADRATNPNTLTLTAGDDFGATPPLSNFFDEVPSILAQRMMGIQVGTFGNHNFDKGIDHLQCMIDIAAAPNDPSFVPAAYEINPDCPLTDGGPGQPFAYVSANLQNRDDNLSGVEDFKIFEIDGTKIAVIGITNPEAPTLVFPGSFGTIVPTEAAKAAAKARKAAKDAGATVFVLITHMGVTGFIEGNAVGPLITLAQNLDGFDVIVGDHTDIQYNGVINGALVYENKSKGVTYARAHLSVNAKNKKVQNKSVEFVTPLVSGVTPVAAITSMLAPYNTALTAVFDGQIGIATNVFVRGSNIERRQEVPLGNLVTDAIRLRYGTQLALTNGGGLRQPIPSNYLPANHALRRTQAGYAAGPPYDVVIGDSFAVLPFGNSVVTRNVTGAQLYAALENGVSQILPDGTGADGRFPQISGFKFTFHYLNPVGSRVTSVQLNDGTLILPDSTVYTLATNDFVNNGGDFYSMFADGQGVTREVMYLVLNDYIIEQGTIDPTIEGRITKLP